MLVIKIRRVLLKPILYIRRCYKMEKICPTLRCSRIAMRESDADAAQAATYVGKALAGVMQSNDDNFLIATRNWSIPMDQSEWHFSCIRPQ